MSIELIDKIKPKNNGSFSLVDACDVEMADGTRLEDRLKKKVWTTLPEDNIARVNVMYFMGELSELNVGFPESAEIGDMLFVSFSSSETPTIVRFTTSNHKGLDKFAVKTNYFYELMGLWNGNEWVMVVHEVM